MNINDAFPSLYLSAADLPDAGCAVTFQSVSIESFEGERKPKAVLFFREFDKGWLLNTINKNTIVEVMGTTETNIWIGRQIWIYPTECDYKGDRVACIRVKLRAPEKSVNGNGGGDGWTAAMLRSFAELNVTRQMIEARLGHSVAELSAGEREQLKEIHKSMLTLGASWPKPEASRPSSDLVGWLEPQDGQLVVQRGW